MTIIPVLDLVGGAVVHAIAGDRQRYRRIHSQLTHSCDPSVVMNALHEHFAADCFYLADLDAIQFGTLNRCTLAELARLPHRLVVDRGVRSAEDVEELLDLGIDHVIVALETLPNPELAADLVRQFGDRLVLSLDLRQSMPQTVVAAWQMLTVDELAALFVEMGYGAMIVLDVAAVGTGTGILTLDACRRIRRNHPGLKIVTGGGVATAADVDCAAAAGVDGLLVASALHNGQLDPDRVRRQILENGPMIFAEPT